MRAAGVASSGSRAGRDRLHLAVYQDPDLRYLEGLPPEEPMGSGEETRRSRRKGRREGVELCGALDQIAQRCRLEDCRRALPAATIDGRLDAGEINPGCVGAGRMQRTLATA